MTRVNSCKLPNDALLQRYNGKEGYVDCYTADIGGGVDLAQLVAAFYKTPLFRAERWILTVFAKRPSTDQEVAAIAQGEATAFAAWDVEARGADQVLLCDMAGRTRSWFMVEPLDSGTRVYFGSAVVAVTDRSGAKTLGFGFSALLGFHKMYSVLLLRGAVKALRRA